MAKLTVKNVGPIREAELEVKKHTVFIGPQGSGKSTLAKLIAIGGDENILPNPFSSIQSSLEKYSIDNYVNDDSIYTYKTSEYQIQLENTFDFQLTENSIRILNENYSKVNLEKHYNSPLPDFEEYKQAEEWLLWSKLNSKTYSDKALSTTMIRPLYDAFLHKEVLKSPTIYIPAERTVFHMLSGAIWSLMNHNINLSKSVTLFGNYFERASSSQNQLDISFLQIKYERKNGQDFIEYQPNQFVSLSQSASGYQSVIPLLLVVEHQRRQSNRRFIIEEPELNLYPTAQKDLIYSLMGGLQPDVAYKDAEWVITTHSPYVLSSFNTLMLAYKVAQKSEELRAAVEKIIPSRCWINPDEFAAYYVDNGTVRSIMSEKTGLISDNELDDVSEDLAGEQDQLLELSRSVPRA